MKQRMFGLCVLILAMVSLPVGNPGASGSLTKCTALPKPLTLAKPRSGPQKVTGTVPARSSIDYYVANLKADANVEIKVTDSALKFEIYSLGPSTKITKNVNWWQDKLYSGRKYVLAINNCTSKTSSRYQLAITWK
ncbi:MAG TPA: hypothetical protein VFX97_00610 [Pyrinomonadaceae bacterium]|nr:hypothetical protein [Pyrinomonadaceae bacterium]